MEKQQGEEQLKQNPPPKESESETAEEVASRFLKLPNVFRIFRDDDSIRARKINGAFRWTFLIVLLGIVGYRIADNTPVPAHLGTFGEIVVALFLSFLVAIFVAFCVSMVLARSLDEKAEQDFGRRFKWGFFPTFILLTIAIVSEAEKRKSKRTLADVIAALSFIGTASLGVGFLAEVFYRQAKVTLSESKEEELMDSDDEISQDASATFRSESTEQGIKNKSQSDHEQGVTASSVKRSDAFSQRNKDT